MLRFDPHKTEQCVREQLLQTHATIERRNEAKFEARARAALARREEVERRSAQREVLGKTAAPLPAALGASAAR